MLIGMGGKKKAEAVSADSDTIYNVTAQDFEQRVIHASMNAPVLVDFWAPWCGPCKQLMPVLEQAVNDAKGAVLLAKVNIDENPELAQALRVQSVPMVFAFFQGQPVTAFTGARPASDIKNLITQLLQMAGQEGQETMDVPTVLAQAEAFAAQGQLGEAQQLYMAVLSQDEANIQAYGGLVRTLIAAEAMEEARGMVDHAPDAIASHAGFAAIRSTLELAEKRPDKDSFAKLRQAAEADPGNHQARFDLAVAEFAAGERGAAIDHLLEIIRKDRAWEEEKARKQLLQFFEAMGPMDPDTLAGRRKLSSLLFS